MPAGDRWPLVVTKPQHPGAVPAPRAGTDGCSGPVAVLKSSPVAPDNHFLSPLVYTLQQAEALPLVGGAASSPARQEAAVWAAWQT